MVSIFSHEFFVHAVIASILISIISGVIGTYIVVNRKVFIAGGISHASFGGIGLGYFLGLNPILIASIFASVVGIIVEFIGEKSIRKDSIIGAMWAFGMAIGIILIYLTPGYVPNLNTYMFGSILAISNFDISLMLGITIIILFVFIFLGKEIFYISFDKKFYTKLGIPSKTINYIISILVALSIVISIRMVGIIMIISLFSIPPMTANLVARSYKNILICSIVFSLLANITGLLASYYINIPSGATIVFIEIILFVLIKIGKIIKVY